MRGTALERLRDLYLRNEKLWLSLAGLAEYVFGYFGANAFTVGRHATALDTAFDRAIPFVVPWVFVYSLAYPLCFTPALFVREPRRCRTVFLAFTLAMAMGVGTFVAYPVTMPRPPVPQGATGSWLLALTWSIDKPYNCFPSLHVALDWLAALTIYPSNAAAGIGVGIIAFLISVSTMFVKQHYALDVLAGFIVAVLAVRLAEIPAMRSLVSGDAYGGLDDGREAQTLPALDE
ncbi:MAG: phosphatase PAP2 family protein [Candidatus Wallbacteria bacterium]|nr:phosphatase PAP2 family protein [Candidatus Wallbacteria bacterium]